MVCRNVSVNQPQIGLPELSHRLPDTAQLPLVDTGP